MKLKWKVDPKPTGQYSSFARRSWPSADYPDGSPAVQLICKDDYDISLVESGDHGEISIMLADYSRGVTFEWLRGDRIFGRKYKTLKEAKEAAQAIIDGHPEIWPKSLKGK